MISDENLAGLPEDGDVSDRVARIVDDSFQEPAKRSKRKAQHTELEKLNEALRERIRI